MLVFKRYSNVAHVGIIWMLYLALCIKVCFHLFNFFAFDVQKFGFASCKRDVGSAEGVNVMIESRTDEGLWKCGITCIEYTEFTKLGVSDVPVLPGSMQAKFPANTNVLFVDLRSAEEVVSNQSSQSLPGMILNLKKPVVYTDYLGVRHSVHAGRVECTMQNIADSLMNRNASRILPCDYEKLDTFIIYNHRRKVTSSAKRRRNLDDHSLHQTPDGSFLDVTRNAFDLLTSCGVKMPQMEGKHCYIESGPPFLIYLHPGLGPLWEIVHQKIRGGSLAEGSELQLEVAEFVWDHVELDGSLLIQAQNILGSLRKTGSGETSLQYGIECGRCHLQRVRVFNKGVNWDSPTNVFWQHKVERFEALRIHLQGNAEFYAHDVTFEGPYTFEVPEGHRLLVTSSEMGILHRLDPLPPKVLSTGSWYWSYTMLEDGHIKLKFVDCL
ncbi:hypothetical protein O6H91_Y513800 [Diphasiastrum complanatum]|nr:hypothetical protein O6H91_Y513800 [Diphasiastrum complanatum]